MNEETTVYEWRPAAVQALTRDLIFLVLFVFILVWEAATSGTMNPFLLALAIGVGLKMLLQAAHAPVAWRMRAWALPSFLFLVVSAPFEDRLWMVPLLIFLILMFGAIALLPSGKVTLTAAAVEVRTFALTRRFNYLEIGTLLPAGRDERIRALTLALRKAPRKALGLFKISREVPILIAREEATGFIEEVKRRMSVTTASQADSRESF